MFTINKVQPVLVKVLTALKPIIWSPQIILTAKLLDKIFIKSTFDQTSLASFCFMNRGANSNWSHRNEPCFIWCVWLLFRDNLIFIKFRNKISLNIFFIKFYNCILIFMETLFAYDSNSSIFMYWIYNSVSTSIYSSK